MADRIEFEQRLDFVEEAKIAELEKQIHLKGIWLSGRDGCPHNFKIPGDSISRCEMNETRPCVYELPNPECEIFHEIIAEWQAELKEVTCEPSNQCSPEMEEKPSTVPT